MRLVQSIALAVIGLIVCTSHAHAVWVRDIAGSVDEQAIQGLLDRGIVNGYGDGTYRPSATINRAELLTILMRARYGTSETPKDLRCFKDLDVQTPQWYAKTVCLAKQRGIVSGYDDDTFRPDQPVNLVEALKISFLTFGILPESDAGVWYVRYLNVARNRGLFINLLRSPEHLLTRGEMARLTYALVLELENQLSHPSSTLTGFICGDGKREGLEQCDDGNVQDGDGCSSICIAVAEPIRHPLLQITQEASGVVTNVTPGQSVRLLKFSAVSNRQDARITALTFKADVGSLLFGQHYTLRMDRDGDGFYETIVKANARTNRDYLVFDEIPDGILLPKDLTIHFVITTDLIPTLGPVGLGITFAVDLPDYVQAEGALDRLSITGIQTDNTCTASNCFINVYTRSSSAITVAERGNLFVTEDTTPTRSHFVVGGNISDALLRLRLRAEGENIDVRKISIDGVPNSVDALLFFALAPGDTLDTRVQSPFASATNGQCGGSPMTRFCAVLPLSTLVVSPSKETIIAVSARMKTEALGAVSGQQITLTLSSATGDDHAIEANGISSSQMLAQNDGNGIASGEIFIGHTYPTTNSPITSPTSDTALANILSIKNGGSSSENYIPVGNSPLGSFTIFAVPHGNSLHGSRDVILHSMTFHITATNVQIDPMSLRLSTKDNQNANILCTTGSTTGSYDVVCDNLDAGQIQSHIMTGQSVTYVLKGNVTNPSLSGGTSTLAVSLQPLGSRAQTNAVEWSDGDTNFSWVDIAEPSVMSTVYR